MKVFDTNDIEEEIMVEVKYKIRYPRADGARNEAIKFAVERLPFSGVRNTDFGNVCVERGKSELSNKIISHPLV